VFKRSWSKCSGSLDRLFEQMFIVLTVVNTVVSGHFDEVYSKLQQIPNVTVYKKEDLPESFHYRNNRRVARLMILTDVGVTLCDSKASCYVTKGCKPICCFHLYISLSLQASQY
jgi:hypothetical protein